MVTFVSLFLGLVLGVQTVEVAVSGPVAQVELLLDGRTAGVLRGEPWTLAVDFGDDLLPHELVAVAIDDRGQEVARARQAINLPRARAEAGLVLADPVPGQPLAARLVWQSSEAARPRRVTASFDGEPLAVVGTDRIELPAYDPSRLHLLAVELEFPGNLTSRVEVGLGGAFGSEVTTELTAVPLRRTGGRKGPAADDLAGVLLAGAEALSVVATEEGRGELVVVIEKSAHLALGGFGRILDHNPAVIPTELGAEERVRFVAPTPSRLATREVPYDLFPISTPFTAEDGSLEYLLTHASLPGEVGRQRIADAVAAAAVAAAAGDRPRSVLLVLGSERKDLSRFPVAAVASYLEALRVPLFLWSTGPAQSRRVSEDRRPMWSKTPWGRARDVSSVNRFRAAVTEIRRELDAQSIAWVEGRHLPQAISLAPAAEDLELAR